MGKVVLPLPMNMVYAIKACQRERLCKELIEGYLDGITGEYATTQGYFVDVDEAESFDKKILYKEKLRLSGQLFF